MIESSILFFSESIDFELVKQANYADWILAVAKEEEKNVQNLNYIFCNDDYLLKINQDHLQHDYYTDVITFPYSYDPISGDVYISIDRVKENAEGLEVTFEIELQRVIIHGLLHLCDYKDGNDSDQKQMRNKENQYISTGFTDRFKL